MITVAEINRREQLAEYRLLWRKLLGRTRGGSFFQTRECLEQALGFWGDGIRLRTLVVCVAGHPVGIVPLVIRSLSTRMGNMRVLTYPPISGAAYTGPIGPNPTATLLGALRHLAATPRDWDLLDLRGIDDVVLDRGRTANAFELARFPVSRRNWESWAVVDASKWDVAESHRRQLRQQSLERELWRAGSWEHLQVAPQGELASETLESTWKVMQPLLAQRPQNEQIRVQQLARVAASLGDLCVQVLRRAGVPQGYLLTVRGNDRIEILDAHAPDPRVAEILVGRLLSGEFTTAEPQLVFGPGWTAFSRGWHAETVTSTRYTHFSALQPRAQLLRLAQWLKPQSSVRPADAGKPATIALAAYT